MSKHNSTNFIQTSPTGIAYTGIAPTSNKQEDYVSQMMKANSNNKHLDVFGGNFGQYGGIMPSQADQIKALKSDRKSKKKGKKQIKV